jgi:beta-1,2-mannobiose phosphorylase / 1,2-beta-oligomannan phosphorylase
VQATINLARSRDGLTNWEKSVENPIVAPRPRVSGEPDSWNCHATYKPFVMFDDLTQQWLMWFNGRCYDLERIGMATLKGGFGNFVRRTSQTPKDYLLGQELKT